jgi:ABC-2 type transport system ATP-binding protein
MSSPQEGSVPVAAFEGVTVRYGRTLAVHDVTLALPRGGVYALLGRNGAGKSSLVRCLLGQMKPAHGRVRLFGRDVWTAREEVMARVGVVPEEPDVPPEMTAADAISFCARLYPSWDGGGVARRLARFGVPATVAAGKLSKGQKGQLALALALGPSPELLVLDDPTLGLDVVARKELYEELVGELADRGTSVLLTTHDLAGVERLTDRVGVLVEGRLLLDEDIESLKARFRHLRFGATDGNLDTELEGLGALGVARGAFGFEAVLSRFDEAAFAAFQSREAVHGAEISGMTLEEIFIAVHESGKEARA